MLSATVEDFVHRFYGYGNCSGRFWLIGMEEGGGGSEEEVSRRLQVWDELGRPETADLAEFHRRLGMPQFFREPVSLQHTWAHLIRLILAANGAAPTTAEVKAYQRDQLGRENGETCLLELLPLPSPSTGVWNYGIWTGLPYLNNRDVYRQTLLPSRIEHLRLMTAEHHPAVVVFYSVAYRRWFEQIAGCEFSDLDQTGIGRATCGGTLFLLVKHPAARGVSGRYFTDAGQQIRWHLEYLEWPERPV